MKLTKRGHYSVKALLDLCLQPQGTLASVAEIAERQSLPAPYLEKLLLELRRSGIVASVRGVKGGYRLARQPADISLGQILSAVGENIDPLPRYQPKANQAEDWVTFSLWKRLHSSLRSALEQISLEELYHDARSWQATRGNSTSFIV
ncbi:MAG: Rrf2 family transcriptional regulator [Leptolyngbyaceae cyanobacterium]